MKELQNTGKEPYKVEVLEYNPVYIRCAYGSQIYEFISEGDVKCLEGDTSFKLLEELFRVFQSPYYSKMQNDSKMQKLSEVVTKCFVKQIFDDIKEREHLLKGWMWDWYLEDNDWKSIFEKTRKRLMILFHD